MRRTPPWVAAVLAGLLTLAPAGARAQDLNSPAALTLTASQKIDSRLTELTFTTPALTGPTPVYVLLPSDYGTTTKRYPVLYLLHGCCNYDVSGAASWTVHGDAEAATAHAEMIVVMPDSGEGGFYSDWYNTGAGGPPMYETYDINELIPWIDGHLRTIADRRGRALAGLSMGGYGSMELAARHPDLFVEAASFSGAVDNMDPDFGNGDLAFGALNGSLPTGIWGPQQTEEVNWRGHDPVDLAENLRGLSLTIRTGNGLPGGPYNQTREPDPIETAVHHESGLLEQTLDRDGIANTYEDYGPGNHTWPYWARDLKLTLPTIEHVLAHPPAPPAQIEYTSTQPAYSVYGWQVAIDRKVDEFSTLSRADAHGFKLEGSGAATVTTPPRYRPGRRYTVTATSPLGEATMRIRAGADRRLVIPVSLGPSNTDQQFSPMAQEFGTSAVTTTVQIAAAAARRHGAR